MITSITFQTGYQKLFKRGQIFELKPFTPVVGDNGTGKSTFLQAILEKIQHPDSKTIEITSAGHQLTSYMLMDFEKDNPRMSYDGNAFTLLSRFRSHGETNMDVVCNHFSEYKDKLVLLDEPDQALSVRSIIRLKSIFDQMISQGCQIIAAIQSETLIKKFDEVLSVEHQKWMKSDEFLKSQESPRKIKTVDEFPKDRFFIVKFKMSDGSTRNLLDKGVISFARDYRRFKKKKAAESNAIREMERFNKKREAMSEFEKRFEPKIVSYEIIETESYFDD